LSTEVAITSVHRAMAGFVGPKDIFRNPESLFRQFEPTSGHGVSPFDLVLSKSGEDFAVMSMHFKLGLYEHQSAGAIGGLIDLVSANPQILDGGNADNIQKIKITAYEPAYGIIGDPAKMSPTTRQSADHSMAYIISSIARIALTKHDKISSEHTVEDLWKYLMLLPQDYGEAALFNDVTRKLMSKIQFEHGGPEYDSQYPKGIPTSISITTADNTTYDSGLVLFPGGHAANQTVSRNEVLKHKFLKLGSLALEKGELITFLSNLENIGELSNEDLQNIYDCNIKFSDEPIDGELINE
jgi:2-methylcitrate dehydratase